MGMDQNLQSFFSELEKIALSKKDAPFMQSRTGRRPIRAHKLLEKRMSFGRDEVGDGPADYEHEQGAGMEDKLGSDKTKKYKRKAIRGAVEARPWVSSGVKGAIPAAVAANFLIPATSEKGMRYKSRIVAGVGALGAAAGVADRALKRWAKRNPRSAAAKQLKKQSSADNMRKVAAMAADLRRTGIGGIKRPPFATEDSKRFANNQLDNSKVPGYYTTHTQQKHLRKPGPSIKQVSAVPGR